MKIFKTLGIALLIVVVTAGCWDLTEIDRRLFVGTIGIDKAPTPEKRYEVHFTAPIVRELAGGGEGGGGGGEKPPVILDSTLADSVTEGLSNLDVRLNRFLFLEHASIFIIGEEAAREGIKEIINPFWRSMVYNRRGHIAIAEGSARKALEVRPRIENLYTEYLARLFRQNHLTGQYYKSELGDFMHHINSSTGKGDALMSKITPDMEEVNIGGAAVIKDYKLVGWLSEDETQGVNFCLGSFKGGHLSLVGGRFVGSVSFKILSAKRKISLLEAGEIPKFVIDISIEGDIESTSTGMVIDAKEVQAICRVASEKAKDQALQGIKKLQKEFEVDLLDISEYLYKYHPKVWKEYESKWREMFPEIDIEVRVDTKVRGVGVAT